MNAKDLAAALGKPQREARGWRCLCPCHDDKDPSLSETLVELAPPFELQDGPPPPSVARAACLHYGIKTEELMGWLFYWTPRNAKRWSAQSAEII
jgi:hypothetical protein